jgi:hypothetical protein
MTAQDAFSSWLIYTSILGGIIAVALAAAVLVVLLSWPRRDRDD